VTEPEMNAELIARIAGPLKAPEHLDETFDARVMSAVHAEVLGRLDAAHAARLQETNTRRVWWLRSRAIQVSPITGFALAASVAAVFFLAGTALQIRRQSGSVVAPTSSAGVARRTVSDTVHIVRFVLRDPAAKSVTLVGDFNAWTKGATHLVRTRDDGTWTISVPLARGRHEYAFIVQANDGERWIADPFGSTHLDEFGTESSVVEVGTGSESSAVNTAS
jgi:predicted carbohydrate-binding protein with CBM48